MLDDSMREYLDKKFDEQERHSKDRMDAHVQMETISHETLNSILNRHDTILHGNPQDDATPGLIKKIDRIENTVTSIKWIGSLGISGIITLIFEKFAQMFGHK